MLFDYFNLTAVIGALVTTTIIVVAVNCFRNTTQQSTPNEEEQAMMLDNVEPSILNPSSLSTPTPATNTSFTIPSLDKGLMGEDEFEDFDGALPKGLGRPYHRQWNDWNDLHLDKSSMEYPTGIGTKFSLEEEPDTNSSVLSTFTFESRPVTPPFPPNRDPTKEKTNSVPAKKQRKASPSRIQATLPPAKRYKKQEQGSLLPQLFPTSSTSTKLLYKRRSTGFPTLAQHGRLRSPKPPLHNLPTIHTNSTSFSSTAMKGGRQCIVNHSNSKLAPVPYQPPTSSQPITMLSSYPGPYPLHKPCPLPPHEKPSPLPPYNQHTIARSNSKDADSIKNYCPLGISSNKTQNRDGPQDWSNHHIVGPIQNQQYLHPYLGSRLLPSIYSKQKVCPKNIVHSAPKGVEISGDQNAKCKYIIDDALSPQENLTRNYGSFFPSTEQYNLVKKEYVSDSQLDFPMSAATNAQIIHYDNWDNNNMQSDNNEFATTALLSVESTPTTLIEDNDKKNCVENSLGTHLNTKQASNIFVQEFDCTCQGTPTFHIAMEDLIENVDNPNKVQTNNLRQKSKDELEFQQITSDGSKTPCVELGIESSSEHSCRENTNSGTTTSIHKDVGSNKTWNKLQRKAFNEQVSSKLQLLHYMPPSPGRRTWTEGAMRPSFYFAHCDICKRFPRYTNL